jgi:hypothetical protein
VELKECLEALVNEQKFAGLEHASNSSFAKDLWMRLLIGYRYFTSLSNVEIQSSRISRVLTNSNIVAVKDCKSRSVTVIRWHKKE